MSNAAPSPPPRDTVTCPCCMRVVLKTNFVRRGNRNHKRCTSCWAAVDKARKDV